MATPRQWPIMPSMLSEGKRWIIESEIGSRRLRVQGKGGLPKINSFTARRRGTGQANVHRGSRRHPKQDLDENRTRVLGAVLLEIVQANQKHGQQ